MRYTRVKWLVGDENYEKISRTRVLIFGLGILPLIKKCKILKNG